MNTGNIVLSPVDLESRKKLDFASGDTVRVQTKIIEKGKTRLQAFEGLVLARKHGASQGASFTVRKVTSGVGVERIFPLYSPMIESIEVTKHARTRRSKLYYIRDKAVKDVRNRLKKAKIESNEETVETKEESSCDPFFAVVPKYKAYSAKYIPDTKILQELLNSDNEKALLKVDGLWGNKTDKEFRAFQKRNEIKVTGKIDTATLDFLMENYCDANIGGIGDEEEIG